MITNLKVEDIKINLRMMVAEDFTNLQEDVRLKTFVREIDYESDDADETSGKRKRILPFGMQIRNAAQ